MVLQRQPGVATNGLLPNWNSNAARALQPCSGGSYEESYGNRWNLLRGQGPVALRSWYQKHLRIDVQDWGGAAFRWIDGDGNPAAGTTIRNIADANSHYFAPGSSTFMVNQRVADLHALIRVLRAEGCNVVDKTDESEYGKFGWVIDPEGNKVERWEPPPGQ